MSYIRKNELQINSKLFDFVNNEIIPGTNIKSEEFWNNFGNIVHELAPINIKLILPILISIVIYQFMEILIFTIFSVWLESCLLLEKKKRK